ncbi:MAG: aminotransferase class I/II-fold pyridoxal phosphate-dependent enzyme, partial [Smithellaceae bacterium]|nr:aminotransferase class I/II-fold pyridoxal phosphate-dependent enzyme [Smithellaceae bacterium]
LPGERIGYIAANPSMAAIEEIMGGLVLCNRILGFVNAPALMQRLIARLQGVTVNVEEYRRKRDLLCRGLGQLGYKFNLPEGAFYLFPKSPLEDDVEFIRILQKQRILAVPGSGFGGPGYFRIAYCVADETITRAMEGFDRAMQECRQG